MSLLTLSPDAKARLIFDDTQLADFLAEATYKEDFDIGRPCEGTSYFVRPSGLRWPSTFVGRVLSADEGTQIGPFGTLTYAVRDYACVDTWLTIDRAVLRIGMPSRTLLCWAVPETAHRY